MPAQIRLFRCLSDNFGVLLHDPETGATAAIDAPEAAPVEAALKETGWTLTDILVTHHHADHTGGIEALKRKYGCRVVAPAGEPAKIPAVDETVREGDRVKVGNLSASVIETPGHTLDHIAYWFHADKVAFAGDTLFAMGCGRAFEAPPAVLYQSLLKLASLPDDTQIYCGHEYTLANARFALSVDPDNAALRRRAETVAAERAEGGLTLPTSLGLERATNPFLRVGEPAIQQSLGLRNAPPAEAFAALREAKNRA